MIADLKPYAEYKESGLPWLGQVPRTWRVIRNGSLFAQRNETGYGELPVLEVSLKTGIRVRNFEGSARKQAMSDKGKYKRALKGDLAYNMMRMWQGAVGVSPVDGLVSPAYVVARPYPGVEPKFFTALFRTGDYMSEVDSCSRGIVKDRNRLYWGDFKQILSPCPSPDEQAAIVRFLDWANGRLERAIRAKRKVIALLNEQKQAIIHRAVTRGLDPSVPFKPSGIPWLGDIPQHWEARRLKSVLVSQLTNGVFKRAEAFGSGFPIINVADIYAPEGRISLEQLERVRAEHKEVEAFRVLAGDIFFVRSSLKLEGTGRCAFVESIDEDAVFDCHVVRARPDNEKIIPRFLVTFLSSWTGVNNSVSRANTVTMSTLAQGAISSLPIALPPKAEQISILSHIDEESGPVVTAISRLEREIELLREYRTRLVADVVTGKLDVREAATRLPDEPLDTAEEADAAEELDSEAEEDVA